MHIVLCADRRVLPGLHVAMYSILDRINPSAGCTHFHLFSDDLAETDLALLHQTLAALKKPFTLERQEVSLAQFSCFPPLNGSWATYYRLFAAQVIPVERFLYVDADILCDIDVSGLESVEMAEAPAGWVPEAPLAGAVDRMVAEQLGNSDTEPYFNAGVMLINVPEWRRQRITEQAMDYIAKNRPPFHDQSALNYVLHRNSFRLDENFNRLTNMRKNWPELRRPYGEIGWLMHFLDYPKPWNCGSEWVHPHYYLWNAVLSRTALKGFRSWHHTPARTLPRTRKAWMGYKKALKDRLLFAGYAHGWIKQVKGVRPS
jgi:lipopolysaccharide biosynthesis glycosyltransferase